MSNGYWIDVSNRQYHASMNRFWKCLCDPKFKPDHWDKVPGRQEDAPELTAKSVNDLEALFTVELDQVLICSICQRKESIPADGGKFLVVDLPSRVGSVTINEAIELSMKSKIPRYCDTCNAQTTQIVQKSILIPPEMLFIQVNRYTAQGKLQNELDIEEELVFPDTLIHDIAKTNEELRYELYGVIFHKGSVKSFGHYTAAIKAPSDEWALVNDEQVKFPLTLAQSMSSPEGGKKDAYILAYRRLPLQGSPEKFIVNQKKADTNTGPSASASIPLARTPSPGRTRSWTGSPNLSSPGKGLRNGGVTMVETIQLDGRDIKWTIKQQLNLSVNAGGLVKLKPRAKTQRATLTLTLISEATGEILEGNANISFKPRIIREDRIASPASMNTRTPSPGTKQTTNEVSRKAAKPQGVKKKTIEGRRLGSNEQPAPRRSARLLKKAFE
ncbi:ubiquitin carboxyl-terminal hydrolase [Aspergillus clavatus NRRL 1]|uniref:USP domain-containing protein n=1 Tax=Aspergillus clavatus (strain ATCC 1007 / CBS 513.65 / DSM 816 / NCTC 3887 / NRRL 1 / QM 1276 / 107) TaxID=344612 RepID=A1CQR2_ASPCL|nr:uncharacterized protein ACLA_027050 [Aspergillus clavatus NRRL 1]EAW07983.1 hypothetical protein ACLA_027050 [Aspergillus clavatus NRRL 1]